jgi:P2 family phage contractile tail tube protein
MTNLIPEKLNDFRVYRKGSTLIGVADLQLPSFESMTETIKGAGIAGEYESPNVGHFGSQKLTMNFRSVTKQFVSTLEPNVVNFDCRAATQVLNPYTGLYTQEPIRVFVKGIPTKVDLGKMEKGSPYENSLEVEITYIKIYINGQSVLELDKLHYKYVINGKDHLATVRRALGM